jgi:hypothetical protein
MTLAIGYYFYTKRYCFLVQQVPNVNLLVQQRSIVEPFRFIHKANLEYLYIITFNSLTHRTVNCSTSTKILSYFVQL